MTTTCTKLYSDIPFAHRQPNHPGHCRFIHGHNWAFEFEFAATHKDECGFVMDFGSLEMLEGWLKKLDHALVINQSDPLRQTLIATARLCGQEPHLVQDCSCEGLAELALASANGIVKLQTAGRVTVVRATVWEDSKNSATAEV